MTPSRRSYRTTLAGLALLLTAGVEIASAAQAQQDPPTLPQAVPARTQAQFGMEMHSLSNGYGSWRDVSLEISRESGPRRIWTAGIHEVTRFSTRDDVLVGGYSQRVVTKMNAFFEGQGSPSHRVLPQVAVAAKIDGTVARGVVLSTGISHRRYDAGSADLFSAGAEWYTGRLRLSYTGYAGRIQRSGLSFSHAARVDRMYGVREENLIGLSVARGEELEQDVRAGLLTSRVRAVSLIGRYWLTSAVGVSYALGAHEQGSRYTRRGGHAAIVYRF